MEAVQALRVRPFEGYYRWRCIGSVAETWGQAGCPEEGLNTRTETLTVAEKAEERPAKAERFQVQAEPQLMQGDSVATEVGLQQALEVAQR
jgi:hypothetical protein